MPLHEAGRGSNHGQVEGVERHRERRFVCPLTHHLAAEWNQDDESEVEQGQQHQAAVVFDHGAHEPVAADPVDADHDEADRESGEVRTFVTKSLPEVRTRAYVGRNLDLEHQKGDRDRKNTVGESEDPGQVFAVFKPGQISAFVHTAIVPTTPDDPPDARSPTMRRAPT
ncbi:MAG: hypothetical protein WBW44_01595 [Solirubrobacterales bacterium]